MEQEIQFTALPKCLQTQFRNACTLEIIDKIEQDEFGGQHDRERNDRTH